MQKLKSFTIIFIFVIAALGLAPSPAGAAVVYSYTGNTFTSISNNSPVPAGTYDTTMRVTGSFTLATPLTSLLPYTDISASITSYSFFDGRQTLDNANSIINDFSTSTDLAGTPMTWLIFVADPFPATSFIGDTQRLIITDNRSPLVEDGGLIRVCTLAINFLCNPNTTTNFDSANNRNSPGTWTVTPAVVPLPPAVLLLGSALVALFGFGRVGIRRRRHV